jgi:hypothetical protein
LNATERERERERTQAQMEKKSARATERGETEERDGEKR